MGDTPIATLWSTEVLVVGAAATAPFVSTRGWVLDAVDFSVVVGEALALLIDGLAPFVHTVLAETLPDGTTWTSILRQKDAQAGRLGRVYSERDLSLMLRSMTERMGDLGYPFSPHLSRQAQSYASELREVRNQWAHNQQFSSTAVFRALDSAELLMREVGADAQADAISVVKAGIVPLSGYAASQNAAEPLKGPESQPLLAKVDSAGGRLLQSTSAAEIVVTALPVLSYAMAHCRIPVVDEVSVTVHGRDFRGAFLEVDVVSEHGSLGGPKVLVLDLSDGETTRLHGVDLVLDPAKMLGVDEQRAGLIRATLRSSDNVELASRSIDVEILAANQWKSQPGQLGMEVLAAHVQPNAAAIAPLLLEASDLLGARTGRSALDGYQSDSPDRVDAMAASVYEAMRARDIRYAEPPASWGVVGQKVRTPGEVLEGRLGTCLDTTVTMAAVLEQAGINSTLWFLNGHMFLGYWREPGSLEAVTSIEAANIVNRVDLEEIRLVETTLLTGGFADSASFEEAVRSAHARLAGDLTDVLGVTDIRRAREERIYPLPSRSVTDDGSVVVSIYQPGPMSTIAPYQGAPATSAAPTAGSVPPRVSRWKNALLDLSLRNRLINYTERSGFRIEVPGRALPRFEDQVNAGASLTLLPSDAVAGVDVARGMRYGRDLPEDARELLLADKKSAFIDITSTAYQAKLRYLAYKARTIQDETGSNNLYLAFGMLKWRFGDRDLSSPLVLIPVSLSTTSHGETYRLTIDESGASTPNYCLLEKLRVGFGMEVAGLAEPTHDAFGIDLKEAFDAMRRTIAAAGLPFRVEETVDLAILQFAKFPLWKDLDENWETLSSNSLVRHLIHSPLEAFSDDVPEPDSPDLDELGGLLPIPADSSQLEAVAAAVAGRTFVLEGPPGTGKSQTITNLLARALNSGRRVLFVAEKRAALDVVKKRLEAVGLGELSLDLHDKSARPLAVRAQIKAALDLRVRADHDTLRAHADSAEAARRRLALYADRLHAPNGVGHSLYSAHAFDLASDRDIAPLVVPAALVAALGMNEYDELKSTLRRLPEHADLARPRPGHPWRFLDERPNALIDIGQASAAACTFDDALQALLAIGVPSEVLGRIATPDELDTWARLSTAPRHALSVLDALRVPGWQSHVIDLQRDLSKWASGAGAWPTVVMPEGIDLDIDAIHTSAIAADASGFFGRKKRRRAVLANLSEVLLIEPTAVKLSELSALTAALALAKAQVTDLRHRLARIPLPLANPGWNPAVPEQAARASDSLGWLVWLNQTLFSRDAAEQLGRCDYYQRSPQGLSESELRSLAHAWRALGAALRLNPGTPMPTAQSDGFLPMWFQGRSERHVETPVSLGRWLDLVRHLEPLRRYGLDVARAAILDGLVQSDDAVLAFDRGVALASVVERSEATALGNFDIVAHNRTIQRFTASTHAIRAQLPRAIPEAVLNSRRFDVGSVSGQMGGLRRQLERQRGGMTVRALLDNYGQLITEIMPCTLMSPESVARFFPARAEIFDVVVFDEASQIRVADAVGAMGRARSVVVVGDSKQMPPTQFAEASVSIEDDEGLVENVLDEESILSECVQARVPSKWLSWHYRSQDESLIAFSNFYYYENRLTSFPAPLSSDTRRRLDGYGVSLVRVNGNFARDGRGRTLRTNKVEADAIVDDVRQRFWASQESSPSLGIITFNAQQRDLIENLLRDAGDERIVRALDEPDGVFVKNLENVQGDERDCILFSVAFSANEKGVVPLNFGPLSKPGGERRLNVAVTRARRQVVLYASFSPEDLRAEETTQKGTKHLKAYLEMAARGAESLSDGSRRQPVIDRHRDEIAAHLRIAGFAVRTDVGLSDFRIDISVSDADDPDTPLVAVLLDGRNWRSRHTVADRDGLPVDVLKGLMRWPGVERIWLPEWLHDREAVLARIAAAVKAAKRGDQPVRPTEVPALSDPSVADVPAENLPDPALRAAETPEPLVIRSVTPAAATQRPARHPLRTPYPDWNPGILGDVSVLDALPESWAVAHVRFYAVAAINEEGPIHPDRLARIVAGAFGLRRVAEGRKDAILRVVPSTHRPIGGDGFLWPSGLDPASWDLVRNPEPGGIRPLDEVSINEIANAMGVVAEESGGMSADEVRRSALYEFGGRRMTSAIEARLNQALGFAVKTGRVESGPEGIYRSGRR
jgi:hypothetical protein